MKIVSSRPIKPGKLRITIDVDHDEIIKSFRDDAFYRLGEPLDDTIVIGEQITCAKKVVWCTARQAWAE